MYTRERIEEVLKHVLKYYTFEKVNPKTLEHLEDNTKEKVDDIVGIIVDDLSDEEEQRLEDSLLPDQVDESFRLINRWGQLAGIIKG